MAHQIAVTNGKHAFTRRAGSLPAWHGLGGETPASADLETWARNAGLTFQVLSVPTLYPFNGETRQFAGRQTLIRSDTGAGLGIHSDGYRVVQPSTVLEFFRDLTRGMGWQMETAGALKGGAAYWALASTGQTITDKGGDETRGYMLLATSCDGSMATHAKETAVRVVCANTLAVAMLNGKGKAVAVKHSTTFDPAAVKRELGLVDWDRSWSEFGETLRQLQDIHVDTETARDYFSELLRPGYREQAQAAERHNLAAESFSDLIQAPARLRSHKAELVRDKPEREIRGLSELMECYYSAPGATPGTGYGLVNAVTRYVDHSRGKDPDKRLTSAWFGQGDQLKTRAVTEALALAA